MGYAVVAASVLFLLLGSYAILFSAFLPLSGVWVRVWLGRSGLDAADTSTQLLDVLARDTHYKYLVVMLVASGTGFVIANWVGWQYYRNS